MQISKNTCNYGKQLCIITAYIDLDVVRLVYDILQDFAAQPEAQESSVSYLAERLSRFIKRMDSVLICFPQQEVGSLSHLMEQAVLMCEAIPVVWGADHRWKSLLRLAFSSRATTIIGPPLIILGLTKLQMSYSTPLFIRNVVTAGYPCEEWMIEGIRRGFDCTPRGCFSMGTTGVVAGFSCERFYGVHLREKAYRVEIVDAQGKLLPEGEPGEVVLSPVDAPELRYYMGENARLHTGTCPCGCTSPLLTDILPGRTEADVDLRRLGETLQSWTSVLDCRLRKGRHGLEMEIITLPGGRLPKLPTAAKQVIRPLAPETDEPFFYDPTQKNPKY